MRSCRSYNNAFLFFPMLGENWHNNHHAVPASLSTWVMWYQVDFVYLTGRLFELLGLASDIRVEVPKKLLVADSPPTGFPALSWTASATVWALVAGGAYHLREKCVAAPRSEIVDAAAARRAN